MLVTVIKILLTVALVAFVVLVSLGLVAECSVAGCL